VEIYRWVKVIGIFFCPSENFSLAGETLAGRAKQYKAAVQ
jgi:hypothetical protein